MVLVPAVVNAVEIPVIAAGGIANGRQMLAAMVMGAGGVQLGSRFVASEEASSHIKFKQAVIHAAEGDTQLSIKKLTPVRLLKNKFFHQIQEAEARGAEERRKVEKIAAAHRARVDAYESDHGGRDRLEATAKGIEDSLRDNPAPDHSFSMGGSLFVAMLSALAPGLFLNAIFHSSGGGILLAELTTIAVFGIWALRRREREQIRRSLFVRQEDVKRQMGCGDAKCSECYSNENFRSGWMYARRAIEQDKGCAVATCDRCYPA